MQVNICKHYFPLSEDTLFYSSSSLTLDKFTNDHIETVAVLLRMSMMSEKCHALLLLIIDFYRGWEEEKTSKEKRMEKESVYLVTLALGLVRENITELPVGDKLLSQMFRQFIRRAQPGTSNKDM